MQKRAELIQLGPRSNRIYFHTPVVQIAGPAPDSNVIGAFLNKPAETDTLHPPTHEVALC